MSKLSEFDLLIDLENKITAVDIARKYEVSQPAVHKWVRKFREKGYIVRDREEEKYQRSVYFNGNMKFYKLTEYGQKYLYEKYTKDNNHPVGNFYKNTRKGVKNRVKKGNNKKKTYEDINGEYIQKNKPYLAGSHYNVYRFEILEQGNINWDNETQVNFNFKKQYSHWEIEQNDGLISEIYIEENIGKKGPTCIMVYFTVISQNSSEGPMCIAKRTDDVLRLVRTKLEDNGYILSEPERKNEPKYEIINSPVAEEIDGKYVKGENGEEIDKSNSCTDEPNKPTEHHRTPEETKAQLDFYEILDVYGEYRSLSMISSGNKISKMEKNINGIRKDVKAIKKHIWLLLYGL